MARTVFLPLAAGLGLLLATPASHAAMAPIVQDAETQHFQMELTVGPMEHMYTQSQAARLKPKDGEVMMSGHMAPMSVTSSTPTGMGMRHLELSVVNKDDGSPVPNAKVSITIVDSMSTQPMIVPVAVMHGVDEDETMLHYGNNVMLTPGHHRVIVSVNGDRATFDVNIPMM
jgi:hypothetical protein